MLIIKILILIFASCNCEKLLDISFPVPSKKHDFEVLIHGQCWFTQNVTSKTSTISITKNSLKFSTEDQSLSPNVETEESGEDVLGWYESYSMGWRPSNLGFETEVRIYQDQPIIVFSQHFQVQLVSLAPPTISIMSLITSSTGPPIGLNILTER